MKLNSMFLKAFTLAALIAVIKTLILPLISTGNLHLNGLIESSDISIVFTGAFFVLAMMLAGTMTDFKEGERIPGEIASNLEAIQDWMMLGLRAPRSGSSELSKESFDRKYLKDTLFAVTSSIISWINSKEKDSKAIFPELRKLNEVAYYFSERGADKEAVKGIQENTNVMRKQITRTYSISRNIFVAPAYILLRSILGVISLLLIITKFKTASADVVVTFGLSFIFYYMYHLIIGLDDPFDLGSGDAEVDIRPLERFMSRLDAGFPEH